MPASRSRLTPDGQPVTVIEDVRERMLRLRESTHFLRLRVEGWQANAEEWSPEEKGTVQWTLAALLEAEESIGLAERFFEQAPLDLPVSRDDWVATRAASRDLVAGSPVSLSDPKTREMAESCGLDTSSLVFVCTEDRKAIIQDKAGHRLPVAKSRLKAKLRQ